MLEPLCWCFLATGGRCAGKPHSTGDGAEEQKCSHTIDGFFKDSEWEFEQKVKFFFFRKRNGALPLLNNSNE